MKAKLVTVIGGSGFIGRYVVRDLAEKGYRVRVAVRRPNDALFLKPLGDVGQIHLMGCNIRDDRSVAAAVKDAWGVVNLVGILAESGAQTFSAVQEKGAARIAAAAAQAGVERLVALSAIGADENSDAAYARTKALGEKAVTTAFPAATILRPSIVFGPEDDFFNRFAAMARLSPVIPLVGADTRFQPVYVGDVADAVVTSLEGGKTTAGKIYELGGPRTYSFRDLMELMLRTIGRDRSVLGLPAGIAKLMAGVTGFLPNAPLTLDQVRMLARDNVVADDALTLKDLRVTPTPVEAILPTYMAPYAPHGRLPAA